MTLRSCRLVSVPYLGRGISGSSSNAIHVRDISSSIPTFNIRVPISDE